MGSRLQQIWANFFGHGASQQTSSGQPRTPSVATIAQNGSHSHAPLGRQEDREANLIFRLLTVTYIEVDFPVLWKDHAPPRNGVLMFRHHVWGRETGEPMPTDPQQALNRRYSDECERTRILEARVQSKFVERNGFCEFVTDWDTLAADEASLETCQLVYNVRTRRSFDQEFELKNKLQDQMWNVRDREP